jgi:hypothetical protein
VNNELWLGSEGGGGGPTPPPSGYNIERSVRFNSADSAYLSRTPASAGNRKTWTLSCWVKRTGLSVYQNFFGGRSGNNFTLFSFTADNRLQYLDGTNTSSGSNSVEWLYQFRDPSAWYHIQIAQDTTLATLQDRVKLYVNGERISQYSIGIGTGFPAQNFDGYVNASGFPQAFSNNSGIQYGNYYLADIHFIDGQALDPTSFGEFDSNGVWQPKAYTGSYGTNGFHLPFSDNSTAAALGTDTSGNGNDWTVNNITAIERNYVKDCTGTPFSGSYSFANMFNGNTTPYMTPIAGTWAVFQPSTAISVNTLEIFGGWNVSASLAPKINNIDITNAPTGTYQWFTPTLTGGASITSLQKFEFYTAGNNQAFIVGAIRINGNILISASGAGQDSLVDSPTNYGTDTGVGGEVRGNYCTLNPLNKGTNGGSVNGNIDYLSSGGRPNAIAGTIAVTSGKWYYETAATNNAYGSGNPVYQSGFLNLEVNQAADKSPMFRTSGSGFYGYSFREGFKSLNGVSSAFSTGAATGDIIGLALDLDSGTLEIFRNGSSLGTLATGLSGTFTPCVESDTISTGQAAWVNFGQRPFAYTAPSGFKALNTANLPTPTIADGSTAMDAVLYTGDGQTTQTVALPFEPGLTWHKVRSGSSSHYLHDAIRGFSSSTGLRSNGTDAEGVNSIYYSLSQSGSNLTVGDISPGNEWNANASTHVIWTWDAGSSTVTNTDGSITSQVRANPSAGFSIVTYTGTASNGTVGHGLGAAPGLIIVKNRASDPWLVYHSTQGKDKVFLLNTTDSVATVSNYWGSSTPDSTVFGVTAGTGINRNSNLFVAYCFAPVEGYSAFGSYTGNGSADGPFVYTGFRPRWVMVKCSSAVNGWVILDTARDEYNLALKQLIPNLSNAENSANNYFRCDTLSNGFKLRTSGSPSNSNAATYIYAAFAEHPFQSARAR